MANHGIIEVLSGGAVAIGVVRHCAAGRDVADRHQPYEHNFYGSLSVP